MSKSYPGERGNKITPPPIWWCQACVSLIVAKRNPGEWRSTWKCKDKRLNEMARQTNVRTTKVSFVYCRSLSAVLYDFLYTDNANEQLTTITVSGLQENTHRENSFVGHVDYFNTCNENNKHHSVIQTYSKRMNSRHNVYVSLLPSCI